MAENTTLRDELARDRTVLANERTLLSYSRTALALIGVAIIIFKFASPDIALAAGIATILAACVLFFWGIHSYRRIAERISSDADRQRTFSLAKTDF